MENASEEMAGVKIQHLRLPKTDEDDDSEEHRGVHRVCITKTEKAESEAQRGGRGERTYPRACMHAQVLWIPQPYP